MSSLVLSQAELELWAPYLEELIHVYQAAHDLIYRDGTARAIKDALDKIPMEESGLDRPYP